MFTCITVYNFQNILVEQMHHVVLKMDWIGLDSTLMSVC